MSRRTMPANGRLERTRSGVAWEWRELKKAIRSEFGASASGAAWAAALGGVALGLELARRWKRRRKRRRDR